jgi:hypothetical protein
MVSIDNTMQWNIKYGLSSSGNLKSLYFLREKGPYLRNGKCEVHVIKLNLYLMVHSIVLKLENTLLSHTLNVIHQPKKSLFTG